MLDRGRRGRIALVILKHIRNLSAMLSLRGLQNSLRGFVKASTFSVIFSYCRVRDEYDSIDARRDGVAGGVVNDLARHGVE